jgi:hypothetical protein
MPPEQFQLKPSALQAPVMAVLNHAVCPGFTDALVSQQSVLLATCVVGKVPQNFAPEAGLPNPS